MKRASLYSIVAFMAFLSCSCSLGDRIPALDPPRQDGAEKGTLVLTFQLTALSQKTLVPPISMEISSFKIVGTGPDPLTDTFSKESTDGHLELSGLTQGLWVITVDALNSDGTIIGHGEDPDVLISAGQVTDVRITIAPLSGVGTLDLVVSWTKGARPKVSVESYLTSMSTGTVANLSPDFVLELTGNPKTATYNSTPIAAGYYLLTLRLYDAGVQFWGIAEAVRIVADQTTSQTWPID